MKITVQSGGLSRTLRVLRRSGGVDVAFDDGPTVFVKLLAAGDGAFELEKGLARIHGAGAALNALDRQLWVNGRTVTYQRVPSAGGASTARDSGAAHGLSASIPAVVLEILVEVGDVVEIGQKLILLESMKMVLPIQAPHAGSVKAVLCRVGDAVAPGEPLVELTG